MKKHLRFTLRCFFLMLVTSSCAQNYLDSQQMTEAIFSGHSGCVPENAAIYYVRIDESNISKYNLGKEDQGLCAEFDIYVLESKNLPAGQKFYAYQIKADYSSVCFGEVFVDSKGIIRYLGGKMVLNCFNGSMNGEWFAMLLVSQENNSYLCARIEPNPIEAFWDDGAKISLRTATPNAFILEGVGFKPNEKLQMVSKSYDELIPIKYQCNSSGNANGMLSPAVVGKTGGKASLHVYREDINEERILRYYWGQEAKTHLK